MKVLLVLFASAFFINVNAQKMKEYKIEIAVKASKEKVWEVITNFENYPSWNSVLKMESNNNLIVGNKFKVTITQPLRSEIQKTDFFHCIPKINIIFR